MIKSSKKMGEALAEWGLKWCFQCQSAKPLEDFFSGENRGGTSTYCKACHGRLYRPVGGGGRIRLTDVAREELNRMGLDYCNDCERLRPLAEFTADNSKPSGRDSHCRDCNQRRSRDWRKTQ